ncbi:hypothetical protein MKZ38_009277 [Zalerion maritima]|uniref:Uncharacterized protein n=1 Tax=Zalerion maritima TaxID=339359 RepID=A0AAD5RTJ4_9PEZI|nr:hypothetical protein MKZ38_009277 [Zalerion maritima]
MPGGHISANINTNHRDNKPLVGIPSFLPAAAFVDDDDPPADFKTTIFPYQTPHGHKPAILSHSATTHNTHSLADATFLGGGQQREPLLLPVGISSTVYIACPARFSNGRQERPQGAAPTSTRQPATDGHCIPRRKTPRPARPGRLRLGTAPAGHRQSTSRPPAGLPGQFTKDDRFVIPKPGELVVQLN